jgi:hypothetical protein
LAGLPGRESGGVDPHPVEGIALGDLADDLDHEVAVVAAVGAGHIAFMDFARPALPVDGEPLRVLEKQGLGGDTASMRAMLLMPSARRASIIS